MTIGEQLKYNFPSVIDKSGEIFSALVANENETGAFEKVLNEALEYAQSYAHNSNVYNQEDEQFYRTLRMLTTFTRIENKSLTKLKQYCRAIFQRGGNTSWGSSFDVIQTFKNFFNTQKVYLAENVDDVDNNVLEEGDFESDDYTDYWTFNSSVTRTEAARISGGYGMTINNSGSLKQTITVDDDESYYLHFFLKGKVNVRIYSGSRYWNATTRTWGNIVYDYEFNTTDWANCSYEFVPAEGLTSITIEFIGLQNGSYLDYARVFEKQNYPTFTVICVYSGSSGQMELATAPGTNDDPTSTVAENYGYYEGLPNNGNTFISGTSSGVTEENYEFLLSYLRPVGVKGYCEVLTQTGNTSN